MKCLIVFVYECFTAEYIAIGEELRGIIWLLKSYNQTKPKKKKAFCQFHLFKSIYFSPFLSLPSSLAWIFANASLLIIWILPGWFPVLYQEGYFQNIEKLLKALHYFRIRQTPWLSLKAWHDLAPVWCAHLCHVTLCSSSASLFLLPCSSCLCLFKCHRPCLEFSFLLFWPI